MPLPWRVVWLGVPGESSTKRAQIVRADTAQNNLTLKNVVRPSTLSTAMKVDAG